MASNERMGDASAQAEEAAYWRRRAAEERGQAEQAEKPAVAAIHRAMAEAYAAKADDPHAPPPTPADPSGGVSLDPSAKEEQ